MRLPRVEPKTLIDPALALALGGGYVALLLVASASLGYARDEGFYFEAAASYEAWFRLLLSNPSAALERATVDRHWHVNGLHPVFAKSLFGLSHHYLFAKWQLFGDAGTAYRFPGMLMGGMAVAITYLWGRRAVGRLAGVVAAIGFAMMPRVFYHSQLACFDIPVAAMWLVTTWAYWRSLDGSLRWALLTGVLYGLLLNTKHNSWLLPPALIAHFVIVRGPAIVQDLRAGRFAAPSSLYAMALIGPVIFYSLWPWIWHDTAKRLIEYASFHLAHEYYNMEFLGRTYWEPPMPRTYAPLMTAATVPFVTLLLAAIGVAAGVRAALRARFAGAELDRPRYSTEVLWVLCILASYSPWVSSSTPIFGGTKHWITAYPFLCLFGARGFVLVADALRALIPQTRARLAKLVPVALAASVLAGPAAITIASHPWGLSSYTPLVGGAPGAASLGLNRTFWGYTTGSAQDFLNRHAPPNASVYLHDTLHQSWDMFQRDGRLRRDLRGTLSIENSTFAIYHHEPHMERVEYQIWHAYGSRAPAFVGTHDGVPVVWVYARPGTLK